MSVLVGVGAGSSRDAAADGLSVVVTERADLLGPTGLFGIVGEPEHNASGPTCVFVSVANEHRVGPARLWVNLSRRLAAVGYRCIRFDINGFGESPGRDPQSAPRVYSIANIDDVVDVVPASSGGR